MAVHHDTFKSAIASAFENSDIKFSKVSDLSKEEFLSECRRTVGNEGNRRKRSTICTS